METIEVCAAVIRNSENKILLATRPEGKHLAGCWEFPGGKVAPGETLEDCIVREIKEELRFAIEAHDEIACIPFDYPEKTIRLHFMNCSPKCADDTPVPQEKQLADWFDESELVNLKFAPADAEFVKRFL